MIRQDVVKNKSGQTSLILILLTAVALIFFAITLNWGTLAQFKTITTTAATNAAAGLASSLASSAEREIQTTLGGAWKVCKHTSVVLAIVALVLIIVVTIINVFCEGCLSGAYPALLKLLAAAAIVLSAANLALQVAVVQPGLTKLWNKLQANLPVVDQQLEQGLTGAAQGSVTDQVTIADYFDLNTNGKFGLNKFTNMPNDDVGRFAFFYTERLKSLKISPVDISGFMSGLETLTNTLTEGCSNLNDPHCNPACQGMTAILRRDCRNTSVWPYANTYPLVYDPSYPNYSGGTSFLAKIGIDAEVAKFGGFKKEDAKGMYSLFWDMADLRTDTNIVPTGGDGRVADAVTAMPEFKSDGTNCADLTQGFCWKPGADLYCNVDKDGNPVYPYDDCAICGADACSASPNEDGIDDVVYGLKTFVNFAKNLQAQDQAALASHIEDWYEDAAMWVGVPCLADKSNESVCYSGDGNPGGDGGILRTYGARMDVWKTRINDWLTAKTYVADDAWCLPRDQNLVPSAEEKARIVEGGEWGSLGATIACLNYNLANEGRFNQCGIDLGGDICPGTPPECSGAPASNPCGGERADFDTWFSGEETFLAGMKEELAAKEESNAQAQRDHDRDLDSARKSLSDCEEEAASGGTTPPRDCSGEAKAVSDLESETVGEDLSGLIAAINTKEGDLNRCSAAMNNIRCPQVSDFPSCENLPRSLEGAAPSFDPCNNPSQYKVWVENSRAQAAVQGPKFSERAALLTGMKTKAENAVAAIDGGKSALDTFLGAPTQALIDAKNNYNSQVIDHLPSDIIYAWRDKNPPKSGTRTKGYWHIVRVQGQIPAKCPSGKCLTNRMPWVRTYTKGFLKSTRCYELADYDGQALVKVSRWDEDHDGRGVAFANKFPIWKNTFQRPGSGTGIVGTLQDTCVGVNSDESDVNWNHFGINDPTLVDLAAVWGSEADNATKKALKNAFMLNYVAAKASQKETDCRNLVRELLSRGVSSKACAKYILKKGGSSFTSSSNQKYVLNPLGETIKNPMDPAGIFGNTGDSGGTMDLKFVECPAGAFDDD